MPNASLAFKIATEPEEFEQIHRLNYRTFVEEIPQHPGNPEKKLVDKYHPENTYCIALDDGNLVAMLALRATRPFSLDAKVPDLDRWLPQRHGLCEIRLLAIEPDYRQSATFSNLIHFAAAEFIRRGYTMAVASGTLRQTRLYRHMGFVPFSDPVGSAEARYQPMYLSLPSVVAMFERLKMTTPEPPPEAALSFMPGPVETSPGVRAALARPALSHRSAAFVQQVAEVRERLCALTGAGGVELLLGSGTLANDVVAAHLKVLGGRGLVLANGEFGERLIDHARRMELAFEPVSAPWGSCHDLAALERRLAGEPRWTWLWSTHCETSCGLLNDLPGLAELCRRHNVKLCVDCTSSLGTVPLDLSQVYLASSVSGKGLAAFPGICLVFCNQSFAPNPRIPRYLDLGYYRSKQGVPFTHSSNLVAALHQALLELDPEERFSTLIRQNRLLRRGLQQCGIAVTPPEGVATPAVLNVVVPPPSSAQALGEALERRGFLLSFRSEYLLARNIIQICLMGRITDEQCRSLLACLAELVDRAHRQSKTPRPQRGKRTVVAASQP